MDSDSEKQKQPLPQNRSRSRRRKITLAPQMKLFLAEVTALIKPALDEAKSLSHTFNQALPSVQFVHPVRRGAEGTTPITPHQKRMNQRLLHLGQQLAQINQAMRQRPSVDNDDHIGELKLLKKLEKAIAQCNAQASRNCDAISRIPKQQAPLPWTKTMKEFIQVKNKEIEINAKVNELRSKLVEQGRTLHDIKYSIPGKFTIGGSIIIGMVLSWFLQWLFDTTQTEISSNEQVAL